MFSKFFISTFLLLFLLFYIYMFSFWFAIFFREKLTAELKSCQVEKQSLESRLASFEIYGREFEVLAAEYSRLRQEVTTKSWALKEFTL